MANHVIPKRGEKYTVNVLELAQVLHEHSTGQSDTHSFDELKRIRDYLSWRVEEAWVPSAELARPFDDAVRALIRVAIGEPQLFDADATMQFVPGAAG